MIPIFHLVPLDSLEIKVSACRAGQWEVAIQLIDHFYRAGHEAEAWKFFLDYVAACHLKVYLHANAWRVWCIMLFNVS